MLSFNSWSDIEKHLSGSSNQTKGELFEQLSEHLLTWDPKYQTLLKQVWRLRDVPTSVLSKINIPSHDQGIDLIAETFEGKFWAIQCKYHGDSDKKVSHREISTFLALSNTVASNISFCLVITTADDYAKLYKGQSNIGFVLSDVWSELPEGFFTEFGKPKKQHLGTPREPRKHQQSAISDATKYFEKEDRGKLIFPCGAGKSLTGYWISKALKAKNVVVAVPSLALVKQTLDDYCRESLAEGNPIAPFCICSDEGIGKSDDVALFSQDLGINCTTDREQIKDFLQLKTDRKKVIFTTYQSGRVLGDAVKEIPFEFDLGILDEAHKTVGAADKLFSFLLFDENVNIRKRIFMTATERRYKGSSDNILSMDDPEIYGDTFTQLSFKEAIDLEILSDYKIITLLITKDEVKEYLKQNDIVYGTELGDNAEVDFRTYASLIALRKAIDKYPIKHAVTFHGSIKRAKLFSELQEPFEEVYPKFSKVSAYHVTGAIPTGIRSKIVREFAGAEKAIITNAKCLTEGVDVPNIDCVLFADPRNSTVDIVQAVGRALRRAGDKEFGYVLLPIYSEEKNGEALLESEDFQNILSTLRALASNDERIVEFFRDKHSASNSAGVKDLIQFDVENISSGVNVNDADLIEQFELKTWNRLVRLSWRPFEEARNYVQGLGIKSQKEYFEFAKSKNWPVDISTRPDHIYRNSGWIDWADFLNNENKNFRKSKHYYDFNNAKKFVSELNFNTAGEYKEYVEKNNLYFLPIYPNQTYKTEWQGWSDFLSFTKIDFWDLQKIGEWIKENKIKTVKEFISLSRQGNIPEEIPKSFYIKYKNEISDNFFYENALMTFEEAKKWMVDNNVFNSIQWRNLCKTKRKPDNLPSDLINAYSNEKDWKGYGSIFAKKEKYLSKQELLDLLADNKIKSHVQYLKFRKSRVDLPYNYQSVYQVSSFNDLLEIQPIIIPDFKDAQSLCRINGVNNQKEYQIVCKKLNLPYHPERYYKNSGWKNWKDFLDTNYFTFEEAKGFVKALGLSDLKDWIKYKKTAQFNKRFPKNPNQVYRNKGWNGWADFLGKDIEK